MVPRVPSILISHPHAAAVASGIASALARRHQLACYATGVAAAEGTVASWLLKAASRGNRVLLNRIVVGVDSSNLRSLAATEIAARLLGHVAASPLLGGRRPYDLIFSLHDAAVARMRWPEHVTAVYGYEDGALRTFERAAKSGLGRIWELPTPHWATSERIWNNEAERWPHAMGARQLDEPEWKKIRKDRELELADVVVVASRFARTSLERIGCRKRIVEVPYGFAHDRFRMKASPPHGRFTVLSVGAHDLRKGTPYLLEAWRRAGIRDGKLRLVGSMKLSPAFLSRYVGLFEHVRHVPRADLEREYQGADLLVFPTLGDGFGLVIQEAMSCGTPVLTTPCGGGPECIDNGVEGWIVAARDVDALVERLRFAAANRGVLAEMGVAARRRSASNGWNEAGQKLMQQLSIVFA